MKSNEGPCVLCGSEGTLVDCHIYPRAFAKRMGHDNDPPRQLSSDPSEHSKRMRTGWYDPALVCQACESRFSEWDDYGIRFNRSEPELRYPEGRPYAIASWRDVDCRRLKLFALSTLWRAHATTLEAFRHVRLGPHGIKLGGMIREGFEGDLDEFALTIALFPDRPEPGMLIPPSRCRITPKRLRAWRFQLDSMLFTIKVDGRPYPMNSRRLLVGSDKDVLAVVGRFDRSPEARFMTKWFGLRGEPGF